jgi:hypothetical protein
VGGVLHAIFQQVVWETHQHVLDEGIDAKVDFQFYALPGATACCCQGRRVSERAGSEVGNIA